MTITTIANSTPRRHCEAKEKITGEKKFICRSNLILSWNNEKIALSLIAFIKKGKLFKLPAMTITTIANSTPRRHCEAKEKITGEKKFICRSNLILSRNNEKIALSLIAFIKKGKLFKLLAMTIGNEIASSLWALIKRRRLFKLLAMMTIQKCLFIFRAGC
ncbi:MAG: hypothetical protein ACTHML_14375 [Ginsengibacter sp.]